MPLFLLKTRDAKIMTEEKTDKFRNSTNMMKSDLNQIKRVKSRSNEQKGISCKFEMLCKARNNVIQIFDGYFSMISEDKY